MFSCSPPATGRHLKVTATGENVTLILCEIVVQATGKFFPTFGRRLLDYPTPKASAQRPGFILVTDRVVEYVVVCAK